MTRIEKIRDSVEALEREREKRSKHGETTHNQTHDDMWMSVLFTKTRRATP